MENKQLQLFDEIGCNLLKPIKRVGGASSQNPIVFNDYESFVAKKSLKNICILKISLFLRCFSDEKF